MLGHHKPVGHNPQESFSSIYRHEYRFKLVEDLIVGGRRLPVLVIEHGEGDGIYQDYQQDEVTKGSKLIKMSKLVEGAILILP